VTAVELAPILNISDWDVSASWFEKVGFRRGFSWSPEPDGAPGFGAVATCS
jgi:hypothetical protein